MGEVGWWWHPQAETGQSCMGEVGWWWHPQVVS